jgi:hypothetical protein
MDYSGIAKDVLAVLPSDPTDQLDLAHRISNLAFNSKVSPFAVGVARPSSPHSSGDDGRVLLCSGRQTMWGVGCGRQL